MPGTTRAPHGSPEFTTLSAFRGTPDHKRKFLRSGGSAWLRSLIDRQRQHEEVIRRAEALIHEMKTAVDYGANFAVLVDKLETAIRKVQA